MIIQEITPKDGFILLVTAEDGRFGEFDVSPYLDSEAFEPLRSRDEFNKIVNGGYFIEWGCGADLSADTIEAHLKLREGSTEQGAPTGAHASLG